MSGNFLLEFLQLNLPVPGMRYPAGVDAKSDLKLVLEIATNSRLKQGQDKKNQVKQIFYCRSLGKDCFKIQVEFTQDGYYKVIDNYHEMLHQCGCSGEQPTVIRIYNLMMLKRSLIQEFMEAEGLTQASPETILQKISGESGEYFYCQTVKDLQSRRKLKKRFDNIVNISIKKKRQAKEPMHDHVSDKGKGETILGKKRGRKSIKAKSNKQNHQRSQPLSLKLQDYNRRQSECYLTRGRKKIKPLQNSSIFSYKIDQNQMVQSPNSEIFPKGDSIFEEQQQDYFKKNSNINIALSMLNEAGPQGYWPESDNSIGQAVNMGDKMRIDDIFTSMKNNLLKVLQRRSLQEIDLNAYENVGIDFHNY